VRSEAPCDRCSNCVTANTAVPRAHYLCSEICECEFDNLCVLFRVCSVDRAFLYNLVNETILVHNIFSIFRQFYL